MRLFIIAVGFLCLFIFAACDDPSKPPPPQETVYPALDEKDDVFEYLELVYTERNIDRYPKLLDDDFIFWFSIADFNDGQTPEQWGRTEELASATNLFNGYAHPKYGAVTGIDLMITPEGLWTEVAKTEPPYTGETWYQRTVEYYIVVETTSEWTLQASEKKALITIRQSEVEGKNIYRIILWNDDTM
jgi:hypothetical protein